MPPPEDSRSERSPKRVQAVRKSPEEREIEAVAEFRRATRRALEFGSDPELLAEEVAQIWRDEFLGGDDDE